MQGMANREITDLFTQAYKNHTRTITSTYVKDDPYDNDYFIIVPKTIVEDPFGKIIKYDDERIGRKAKPIKYKKEDKCNLI